MRLFAAFAVSVYSALLVALSTLDKCQNFVTMHWFLCVFAVREIGGYLIRKFEMSDV